MARRKCKSRGCKCVWYYAGRRGERKIWKCAHCPGHTFKAPRGVL